MATTDIAEDNLYSQGKNIFIAQKNFYQYSNSNLALYFATNTRIVWNEYMAECQSYTMVKIFLGHL